MKHAFKIATLGLIAGTAVTALTGVAAAHGRMDQRPPMAGEVRGAVDGRDGPFAATFAELDVNGDGAVTVEDFAAGAEAKFAEADSDGNGSISLDELKASIEARVAANAPVAPAAPADGTVAPEGDSTAQTTPPAPMGRGGPALDPAQMATRMAERMLARMDANGDGALSLDEMTPGDIGERLIARIDTDKDGAISEAEFDAAKAAFDARVAQKGDRGDRGGKDGRGDRGPRGVAPTAPPAAPAAPASDDAGETTGDET